MNYNIRLKNTGNFIEFDNFQLTFYLFFHVNLFHYLTLSKITSMDVTDLTIISFLSYYLVFNFKQLQ